MNHAHKPLLTITVIVIMLLMSGLALLPGGAVEEASATSSGSTYSGSGNWAITSATVYTDETLTVKGNIVISGSGSLTLTNTDLIIDCPSGSVSRYINISLAGGACWMKVQSGSTITTTNATAGTPNLKIQTDNDGKLLVSDSSVSNCWFSHFATPRNYFNDTIFSGCRVSGYSGRPISIIGGEFKNVNQSNHVIVAYKYTEINGVKFSGITQNANYYLIYQSNTGYSTISNSEFPMATRIMLYFEGNVGNELKEVSINNNTFAGFDGTVVSASSMMKLTNPVSTSVAARVVDNIVTSVKKGSACYLGGATWVFERNTFESIELPVGSVNTANAVYCESTAHLIFNNNTINNIEGPDADVGGTANGVFSYMGGNLTISNNIVRNVSYVSNAFCVSVGAGTGINMNNNTILNVLEASDGFGIYGGNGAVVENNTIVNVDASSCGVRLALKGTNHMIKNNVVVNPTLTTGSVQTAASAYSVNAEANGVQGAVFENNTVTGRTTSTYPDYYINGGVTTSITIDAPEDCHVISKKANVTFRSSYMIGVEVNDEVQVLRYANTGVGSYVLAYNSTVLYHSNITVTLVSMEPFNYVDITLLESNPGAIRHNSYLARWLANGSGPVTYYIGGMDENATYRVTMDGETIETVDKDTVSFGVDDNGEIGVRAWSPMDDSFSILYTVIPMILVIGIIGMLFTGMKRFH